MGRGANEVLAKSLSGILEQISSRFLPYSYETSVGTSYSIGRFLFSLWKISNGATHRAAAVGTFQDVGQRTWTNSAYPELARERSPWLLTKKIFHQVLEAFKESNKKMTSHGQHVGMPRSVELSGRNFSNAIVPSLYGIPYCWSSFKDEELIKRISPSTKSPSKRSFSSMAQKVKFVIGDKSGMGPTIKQLNACNDILDSLLPLLNSASCKVRLMAQLSMQDTQELYLLCLVKGKN